MLLKSRTQWCTLSNSHDYSNRQTKWSAYMYSDICMCVLYTYTLQSSVSWSGVPVQMRAKVFFSSLWLSWFHHIFCVHKDSPANVTAYDCMNVLVRIVWVCICASVEFANNPDRKVSKHAEKQRKENKKRSHSSVIHHFVSPCIFGCHVPWHNQNSFRRSDINVLSVALARKQFLCLSLDFTVWTSPLSWKALVFRV